MKYGFLIESLEKKMKVREREKEKKTNDDPSLDDNRAYKEDDFSHFNQF